MMTAKISVVVPLYNRQAIVLQTLDSLIAGRRLPDRLVVVDDGSTDDGAQRVAGWLTSHNQRLNGLLLRQANRGVAAARNRGLSATSDCDFVAFLDSDDRWPSDFLERTSAALSAAPEAVAVSGDRELHCPHREPQQQNLAPLSQSPIKWMLTHGAGIGSATLFRTSAIRRRGGFDETLLTGEDAALFLRLSLDGSWLHAPGEPVVFNRGLTTSGGGEGNLSHKFRDNYRRWARVYEDFFAQGGGDRALPPAVYRRLLAKAWYRAGRELVRGSNLGAARECFLTALAWNRWSYKTRMRLVRTYLSRAASSGDWQSNPLDRPVLGLDGPSLAQLRNAS